MSFPKYPAYKDSGVEWLGEVPEHWEVIEARREIDFLTSGSRGWAEYYSDEGPLFLRIGNLTRDSVHLDLSDLQRVSPPADSEGSRTRVQPGDVLFSITAYLGSVAVVPDGLEEAYVSQHVCLARLSARKLMPDWMAYSVLSASGKAYLEAESYGGTKVQLSLDDIKSFPLTMPPIKEQKQTVYFLDHETSKIDALIAEQQRLIELLQEKRQAVISHAVTKGLNPDAPMKDSGVEWLGEVPEHWEVCSMRRVLLKIEQGWSPECLASPAEEGEWGVVKAGCVNGGAFNQLDNKTLPHHLEPPVEYEIQAGDLLMSRASGSPDLIGSAAFIEHVRPKLLLSDKTFRLRTAQRVDPRYLADVLGSTPLRQQIRRSISGAVGLANNLPQSEIKDFIIPLPPAKEQQEIHKLLVREKEHLNTLLNESESLINLLQERRSALISAAVIGQIEVSGLVSEAAAA
jgi:type I restriction enzyme, S subunit